MWERVRVVGGRSQREGHQQYYWTTYKMTLWVNWVVWSWIGFGRGSRDY